MPDPITVAAIAAVIGEQLTSALQDLAKDKIGEMIAAKLKDNPTDRLKAARERDAREWQLQRILALADRVRDLETAFKNDASALTLLEARLNADEFWGVEYNFQIEAGREPIAERRRMLAFAAAGALNVEMSLAEVSRVERTIRELDPEDVLVLAPIAMRGRRSFDVEDRELPPAFDALMTAGCISAGVGFASEANPGAYSLTSLGFAVAKVMTGYVNARGAHGPLQPNDWVRDPG